MTVYRVVNAPLPLFEDKTTARCIRTPTEQPNSVAEVETQPLRILGRRKRNSTTGECLRCAEDAGRDNG